MSETPGEVVATQIDTAIAGAEARVEAAEAINEALADAAIRDKLTGRIDDCEEGISTCQSDQAELENELQAMQIVNNHQSQELARLSGMLAAQSEQIAALIAQPSLNPPRSPGEIPPPLDHPSINPDQPNLPNADADGPEDREPAHVPAKRGRLI